MYDPPGFAGKHPVHLENFQCFSVVGSEKGGGEKGSNESDYGHRCEAFLDASACHRYDVRGAQKNPKSTQLYF